MPRGALSGFLVFLSLAYASPGAQTPQANSSLKPDPQLADGIGAVLGMSVESFNDAERAASNLAAFVAERTGHRLANSFVQGLAIAEWRARSFQRGTISIEGFTVEATKLLVEALAGPGAELPKTSAGATPYYVLTPAKVNAIRSFFLKLYGPSPGIAKVNDTGIDEKNLYPVEAFLVLYLSVSEDPGLAQPLLDSRVPRSVPTQLQQNPSEGAAHSREDRSIVF